MRSWNIGLCPGCGDDHLVLQINLVYFGEGELRLPFRCRKCEETYHLGLRKMRGQTQFAWLYDDMQPVLTDDGLKAPIDFNVEYKEDK